LAVSPAFFCATQCEGEIVADIIELTFEGDWRITVTGRNAGWSQRVRVTSTRDGEKVLGGAPGNSMNVLGADAAPWKLRIEHDDGEHGWQPSWVREASSIAGIRRSVTVESEDITTPTSDRDFDDLVIRLDKLGAVSQPLPPFAVRPETQQAMPEGVFEASLGRYFMAVRIRNIWGVAWPATARVGLTDRCRAWLAAGGVRVVDAWPAADQEAFGQTVVGGKIAVGTLAPWDHRLVYFKVDVTNAVVRKHQVELQVDTDSGAEELALINPAAKAPIFVSRTMFDDAKKAFVSECDVGVLTAAIRGLTVDHTTFKRAMGKARKLAEGLGGGTGPGGRGVGGCDPKRLDWIRRQLRAFLDGQRVDLCALLRELACCCAGGGNEQPGGPDDPWTGRHDPGLTFFAWPTVMDYGIEYRPGFADQFGPFPFDDPWWKILLIIIAIILSIAAAASSVADLANRSDDVVIGTLARSIMSSVDPAPTTNPPATDPGSIDAAVARLNGNRALTTAVFTLLDAEASEFSTGAPIVGLGSHIDTPGTTLTNVEINAIFQNLANNPGDPAAQAAVRAYKSGARSGLGHGVMSSIVPVYTRHDHDGVTRTFVNQIQLTQDGDSTDGLSCSGDSGSLWLQEGTNAVIALNHGAPTNESGNRGTGSRIEDVMTTLGIRFA
jgi:hypothetical protein